MHRTPEQNCRENVVGYFHQILYLIAKENDGMLAPFMMAKITAEKIVDQLESVCGDIANRDPRMALRYVANDAEERAFLAKFSPEEIADFDRQILEQCRELGAHREAARIEAAHPQTFGPIIDGILDTVRPPR